MWFLIVVLVLAALGLLGAVLKAVLLLIGAVVLAVVVAGWLGYRSLRKQLEQPSARQAPPGTTTIVIGEAARNDEPPGQLPHGRDDRY